MNGERNSLFLIPILYKFMQHRQGKKCSRQKSDKRRKGFKSVVNCFNRGINISAINYNLRVIYYNNYPQKGWIINN